MQGERKEVKFIMEILSDHYKIISNFEIIKLNFEFSKVILCSSFAHKKEIRNYKFEKKFLMNFEFSNI